MKKMDPKTAHAKSAQILVKHGVAVGTFHAQCEASFDYSGSTEMNEYHRHFYSKGYMDSVATLALGFALVLDDNKMSQPGAGAAMSKNCPRSLLTTSTATLPATCPLVAPVAAPTWVKPWLPCSTASTAVQKTRFLHDLHRW